MGFKKEGNNPVASGKIQIALEQENQAWGRALSEQAVCFKKFNKKMILEGVVQKEAVENFQSCMENLFVLHVIPKAVFPNLVEGLIAEQRKVMSDLVDGKIDWEEAGLRRRELYLAYIHSQQNKVNELVNKGH